VPEKKIFAAVFLLLIFGLLLCMPGAFAWQRMQNGEMARVTAAGVRNLAFAMADEAESLKDVCAWSRVYIDGYAAPSMYVWEPGMEKKNLTFGSNPIKPMNLTIKDLEANTWVMEEAEFYCWRSGRKEQLQLWLVIDTAKVPRNYYRDQWWEMEDGDYAEKLRREFNQMNLTGVDGKPLTVATVVHSINYDPRENEWLTVQEPVYHVDGSVYGKKSTYVRENCFYRRAYWITFQY
jgi:hypothetical protein